MGRGCGSAWRRWQVICVVSAFMSLAFIAYLLLPDLPSSDSLLPELDGRHGGELPGYDPHAIKDKMYLYGKIQEDKQRQRAFERLRGRLDAAESELRRLRADIDTEKSALVQLNKRLQGGGGGGGGSVGSAGVNSRANGDAEAGKQTAMLVNASSDAPLRDRVREMMRFAWSSYARYAWGMNELRPVSKIGHTTTIFGNQPIGATIVDAVDTLYLMGLSEEFDKAKEWIRDNLQFDKDTQVSVFEMNIRFIGGLVSAYYMSGERMFVEKAVQLADRLLPAFNTPTGLPYSLVNLRTKAAKNYNWASGSCSILSEIGTLHMEFAALSEITGNKTYLDKVLKIRSLLANAKKPNGLYPNFVHPVTGAWCQQHSSLAGLGDSFYEYLLKEWLRSGKRDSESKRLYEESLEGIERFMMRKSDKSGLLFLADVKFGRVSERKMDHLACFAGGLFALHASVSDEGQQRAKWLNNGAEVTRTCRESYVRTAVKLGPESFRFDSGVEAIAVRAPEKVYILRPETVESYFYLWRITGQQKYRDWAADVVNALETHCKAEAGYSGLRDVYSANPSKDDVQQSFFLAETLKYLYLIFSDTAYFSLDKWVFNTEAHPLPVRPHGRAGRIAFR